jgi:NitT/TauT family transport system substrate-binding protein/putative hydroxymethylpyrimidine transport system substrate-binding protein
MRSALLTAAVVLVAAAGLGCGHDDGGSAATTRPARLALDFQPNAAHAGIYAALADDLDARHGLDLDVRVPGASTDSLKLLAAGRSDLSIVDIHDLGLAREAGADVVGVGALVQRPLAAVIAQPSVERPRDLEGKRVGVTGLPSDEAVLRAIVENDGGDYDRVRKLTIGFAAVPALAAGKVDAVVTFWNAEGVALRTRGVKTREFRVDEYGAPSYPELVVATTSKTLRERRPLVDDVVATLADGTRAALADRTLAVGEVSRAAGSDDDLTRRQLEAIAPALRPPLRLDPVALDGWAAFDAEFGILREKPDVGETFPTLGG